MWAAKAAKLGYRWKIGNGRKIKFWEDNWLGSSSLAVQFWELYVIVNEKASTVADLWDVVQLASTIVFSGEEDELIWMFSSNGTYNSQSLYRVINFRGITPVHVPRTWSLHIPPRVQSFLWLLFNNKVLIFFPTRDNLGKRQQVNDVTCLFCNEVESSQHLFFDCVVARRMWCETSIIVGRQIGKSFDEIGVCWLSEKRFTVVNMLSSAALWALWKLRNDFCFQNGRWKSMQQLLMRVVGLVQNWIILCPAEKKPELEISISKLQCLARDPEMLAS
jgi:hypothetical protein